MADERRAAPVEFWFDFVSPYAYFGSTQIERVVARHGRAVDWRPVLIGITVLKVMGMRPLLEYPMKGDYLRRDGVRVAELLGVPFRHHGLERVNSVAASRAFLWLKREDPERAVPFARRMFDRLWVRGADITPVQASAEEAAALGADAAALRAALEQPEAKQALKDEVDAALARGVFGVPFFIADGEAFWGSDRLPMLEHWLEHRRWDAVR